MFGGLGSYDFFAPPEARIEPNLGLLSPSILCAGLLLIWATRLLARATPRERFRGIGIRTATVGILIALVPPLVGYVIDVALAGEGRYLMISAAFLFGQCGACLVLFSFGLLLKGGAFS